MKTKLYSSMIVTLLVVGMVLTLPVASVQARGRPMSTTPFTVDPNLGGMLIFEVTLHKQIGDRILQRHEFVWQTIADDPRASGYNHNTMFWQWEGVPMESDGIMWGTRVVREGLEPDDPVIGHGHTYGRIVDEMFTWEAVEVRKGPTGTYKVISWSSMPFGGPMDIHGVIIAK